MLDLVGADDQRRHEAHRVVVDSVHQHARLEAGLLERLGFGLGELHRPHESATPHILTAEVAQCIWDNLHPRGVAVVIEASHACMTARGVRTPGVMMITSQVMGTFRSDEKSRQEVLKLMGY